MIDLSPLVDIMMILAAMVTVAAIFDRLKLGTTLGYLAAGLLIGPAALGLVEQSLTTDILGELGVVFLLFMIGLELPLKRIQTIGARVMVMGLLQVCVTTALFAYLAMLWGASLTAGIAIGTGLALSSTTIVLRQLTEQRLLTSRAGRSAFAILMVQDLLVGPILVTILALTSESQNLAFELSWAFVKSALAVSVVIFTGRYLLDLLYRPIAASNNPELFTALSFLVVIGIGFLTHEAGLSLAFGGFLAGVLLADTHYRHQVAADVRPLRGLLVGVFFVTVGMRIEPLALVDFPLAILAMTMALLLVKAAIIILLGVVFGLGWQASWRAGLMLAQGGEFAFVLWATALDLGVLSPELTRVLILVIAISMAVTPLLFQLITKVHAKRPEPLPINEPEPGEILQDHVVVIGCGTVGVQVIRGLMQSDTPLIALDQDAEKVRTVRKINEKAFFGDASHPEMLEMLHVERALAVIVTIDDQTQTTRIAALLHYLFDDLPILVRAADETHAQQLREVGATIVVPEVINTGEHLLKALRGNANTLQAED